MNYEYIKDDFLKVFYVKQLKIIFMILVFSFREYYLVLF